MQVLLSKNAAKEYIRLPKRERVKISKKLELLENSPLAGIPLSGGFKGIYSLRVWPHRILYEINISKDKLEIHKITHRQGDI